MNGSCHINQSLAVLVLMLGHAGKTSPDLKIYFLEKSKFISAAMTGGPMLNTVATFRCQKRSVKQRVTWNQICHVYNFFAM